MQSTLKPDEPQITNFRVFLVCGLTFFLVVAISSALWHGLAFLLVVPIFIALWRWIKTRCIVYELTSERLLLTAGVLSKSTDTLELYRVKDIRIEQPFFLRLFGLCNILLHTSDNTTPLVVLPAMPARADLQDLIRNNVERCRVAKGVREVDFDTVKNQ